LEIQEEGTESNTTLEVMLSNDSHNLGPEVNITKQVLFSLSMSKIRGEALYRMFSLSDCHTLFGGLWLIDYGVNCKGHD